MKYFFAFIFSLCVFSCQNLPGVSPSNSTANLQGKSHHESVKEEKKRQSEADLPFRILDASKKIDTIAFGSCLDQDLPQPVWKSILKNNPDLFVLIGGGRCSYQPLSQATTTSLGQQYRKLNRNAEYREIREKIPFLTQWSATDLSLEDKETTRNEFIKYWNYLRTTLPKNQKALYHSKLIGSKKNTVQIILLDPFWDRSELTKSTIIQSADISRTELAQNIITNTPTSTPMTLQAQPEVKDNTLSAPVYSADTDKSKRILSDEQWAWLDNELRKPATLRILISPLQFLANDHSFEKWGNFPLEREKLLNLIKTLKLKNLLVLSGNQQLGAIAKFELKNSHFIYEATSSGLNKNVKILSPLKDSTYISDAYPDQNFGLIKINWDNRKVTLQIQSVENATQQQIEFSF